MIVGIRKTGLVAPFMGAALLATVLLAVSACALLPFSLVQQEVEETAGDSSELVVRQFVATPKERKPPPFEAALSQAPPPPPEKPALLLTVAEGDSVSGIAQRYGVPARRIIALNDLAHPYWLQTGQRLLIPHGTVSVNGHGKPPVQAPPLDWDHGEAATTEVAAPAHEVQVAAIDIDLPAPERGQVYATDVPLPPTRNTFLWPIEGRVISGFGSKPGGMHNDGINIAVPVGSAVRASQSGIVAYAGNELRGYGNLVLIRHGGGWMTAYAHNDSLLVDKGDVVRRGQVISRSGKTGRVSRPQSHFEIRRHGEPLDPLRLLTRK